WFYSAYAQTKAWPLVKEAASEFNVSEKTVRRAVKDAGIVLPRGRTKKLDRP
ncbi:TPA: RepA protein, partial [Corynebacterium striatum]|nr:RepA protein [Corynebacterium striatum]HAT6556953.1 RepA protein [Corynebacterium striatum]